MGCTLKQRRRRKRRKKKSGFTFTPLSPKFALRTREYGQRRKPILARLKDIAGVAFCGNTGSSQRGPWGIVKVVSATREVRMYDKYEI